MVTDILTEMLQLYPKAKDCIDGHIGLKVLRLERELADDRYYQIKVTRCSHCNMPLEDEYED